MNIHKKMLIEAERELEIILNQLEAKNFPIFDLDENKNIPPEIISLRKRFNLVVSMSQICRNFNEPFFGDKKVIVEYKKGCRGLKQTKVYESDILEHQMAVHKVSSIGSANSKSLGIELIGCAIMCLELPWENHVSEESLTEEQKFHIQTKISIVDVIEQSNDVVIVVIE